MIYNKGVCHAYYVELDTAEPLFITQQLNNKFVQTSWNVERNKF